MESVDEEALADLLDELEELVLSMEAIEASDEPGHTKYSPTRNLAINYNKLAHQFGGLTKKTYSTINIEAVGTWSGTVWPQQKVAFFEILKATKLLARQAKRKLGTPATPKLGFEQLLHPEIEMVGIRHYLNRDFRNAVLDAAVAVFDKMRAVSGLDQDGENLCNNVLSASKPVLVLSELETESGRSDQRGFHEIFKGFYKGVRNPKAHTLQHDLDETKAAQQLVLASILMRRLDEATLVSKREK